MKTLKKLMIALVLSLCSLSFATQHTQATSKTCIAPSTGKRATPVSCFLDPCTSASCKAFPKAECVSNYCGGCNALFFQNKTWVSCSKNSCTNPLNGATSKPVRCKSNPCDGKTCPAYPQATCFANHCGGCHAIFFHNSERVSCTK